MRLRDGAQRSASVNPYRPIPQARLRAGYKMLVDKFNQLVTPVLGAGRTDELVRVISTLEDLDDVSALAGLTQPGELRRR